MVLARARGWRSVVALGDWPPDRVRLLVLLAALLKMAKLEPTGPADGSHRSVAQRSAADRRGGILPVIEPAPGEVNPTSTLEASGS